MMVTTQYPVYKILGTHNVRDLGGYRTKSGKITKTQQFIRSDSLHKIGKEGINFLVKKNLTTVIDLRTSNEIKNELSPFSHVSGVKFINIPLLDNLAPTFLGTGKIGKISNDPLLSFYLSALHERQFAIRDIFSAISEADPGLILFNCTAGKDRTGIISALLLGLVEVPAVDIIKNYTDSEIFISKLVKEFLERSRERGGDTESYARMLRCPAETMASALESIYVSHKNIYSYLRTIGLSEEQLFKVSHRLVETNLRN
tara:strand:- start:409 stop:1182 length:774 start_codon:yes stop_codon:yes gene_type:complete